MGDALRVSDESPEVEQPTAEAEEAVRRGLDDVEAGRVTPIEKVRELIPQWTSKSSSQTKP